MYQTLYELEDVGLSTRSIGLITSSASMGLLFAALLLIVRRADVLIASRAAELQAAYNDLRAAESMRDDLTNMIIHDLRNPLNAISGIIDLLTRPHIANQIEMRQKMLNTAQNASDYMTGLIDDLLTVGKIESGALKLNLHLVTLLPMCDELLKAYQPQFEADNHTLTLHCSPHLTATLDAELIRRVLENLIGNALKYTETKVELHITPQPARLLFTVRDDGGGVPDAFKKTIFSKYQQAPNATTPIRKGTGLGLTFCRLVIELHGGEIWVSDAPEKGSDFNFWLPQ
jgi:signal transduction histidine kinase